MKNILSGCVAVLSLLTAINTTGQIPNPKKILEKKITRKVEEEVNKKDVPKKDTAVATQPSANEAAQANSPTPSEPSLQTYSKFDFMPGEKILFYEDFSQDNVGDFPALWNTNGSAEIVTTNLFPGKWMKFAGDKCIWTDALLQLPDNYTIEFDIIPIIGERKSMEGYGVRLYQAINERSWDGGAVPGKAGLYFKVEYFGRPNYRTYINGTEGTGLGLSGYSNDDEVKQLQDHKYHISIWIQKARVRIYQNEVKLFDLPKAFPVTSVKFDRIRFEDGAAMVSNIRVAIGQPDTRSKLITEGKLVTYGINFDVNKDIVKPESYGTLKSIADVLKENPGLKIKIIGHTDADGNDAANMDLSQRRAVSVKNELIKSFGIEASRMETDGKGESQPLAPNDNPSNKALNRRVEFIKL